MARKSLSMPWHFPRQRFLQGKSTPCRSGPGGAPLPLPIPSHKDALPSENTGFKNPKEVVLFPLCLKSLATNQTNSLKSK